MPENQIRFGDGASYDRMMGIWSRLVGKIFLDWLALPEGLRCLDVGCGNGAFTELLVQQSNPLEVHGIDPSADQLAFARARHKAHIAKFRQSDAMALPFADGSFDAALMALVIFYVPDPAKSVAEMARVVRSGGMVATYAWDLLGGGSPTALILSEIRRAGIETVRPPSADVSRTDSLQRLWAEAGLNAVEVREITVERAFANFDDFWTTSAKGETIAPSLAVMSPGDIKLLKKRVHALLPEDAAGRVSYTARANAIKGLVPK